MHSQNKVIDKLNYYRINNGRCHEAQGRHFHLEKKMLFKKMWDLIRVNTIYFNLQHPIMQPPTPTMVPWLPKQLKEKFDNVKIDKYLLPKNYLASFLIYMYETILSDCHNSDEINILLNAFRLKKIADVVKYSLPWS